MSVVVPRLGFCAPPPQQVETQTAETQTAKPGSTVEKKDSTQGEVGTTARRIPKSGRYRQTSLRLRDLGRNFLQDQKQIWTSPTRLRFSDTEWLVPFGRSLGRPAGDGPRRQLQHLSHDPKTISHYNTISNAGIGALVGGAAGMWLLSYPSHNEHWRETGLLAGQAALNSLVAVEAFKYSLGRERPLQGGGVGSTSFREERRSPPSTPPRRGLWQA